MVTPFLLPLWTADAHPYMSHVPATAPSLPPSPPQAALEASEQASTLLVREKEAHRRDLEALELRHRQALGRLQGAQSPGELRQVRGRGGVAFGGCDAGTVSGGKTCPLGAAGGARFHTSSLTTKRWLAAYDADCRVAQAVDELLGLASEDGGCWRDEHPGLSLNLREEQMTEVRLGPLSGGRKIAAWL